MFQEMIYYETIVECSADEMNDARHGFDLVLRTIHPRIC
jgi:hypothetical protein